VAQDESHPHTHERPLARASKDVGADERFQHAFAESTERTRATSPCSTEPIRASAAFWTHSIV
jgi:hypothetical protein